MSNSKEQFQPSEESNRKQISLARKQGEDFTRVVKEMTESEAHDGGKRQIGDYIVGYAVEEAEGMWTPRDGKLEWNEPQEENVHVEIVVQSAADERFLPGLSVRATLSDDKGNEIGTHEQPFLWHPWIYHYGRNWKVPGNGTYRLKVHVDPPAYPRHDRKNGNRFAEPVDVEFDSVKIETGRK